MPEAIQLPSGLQIFERGWLSSNNVLLIGKQQTALIDSGYVSHAAQTVALLEHALRGRPLDLLVNTHLHSDHCGGNAALQARYACRTLIPHSEMEKVGNWDQDALSYRATGQRCDRFRFDAGIVPGQVMMLGDLEWQAMAAPGHDPHSLVLYCVEYRILVSADALWENGFGVIFPELQGEPGFVETRATLDMIAELDVSLVIPGHGAPFADVDAALERAYARVEYLSADPVRNASNAVKVMLKFLLLERQQIALLELPNLLESIPLFGVVNQTYLGKDSGELAEWLVGQLVKAGVARVGEGFVWNVD